jgi:hypothetical protein
MTTATLFDVPAGAAGPCAKAAALTLAAYAAAGVIDGDYDALMVAHVISLAGRLDNVNAPAYGLAAVSRELREIYHELEARRAGPAAGADPLGGIMDDEPADDAGAA